MNTLCPGPALYRNILAVDLEGSTTRVNSDKAKLREAMYVLLERALLGSGISDAYREDFVDRGDGILALIRPVDNVPQTLLLSTVVPMLEKLLVDYASENPGFGLRMRVVVHAGEVHFDGRGCFGEALDVAFRLLDAPEVKDAFRSSPRQLLLVASDYIYRSVIRHRYEGIDPHAFLPLAHVCVAGFEHEGWVHMPGYAGNDVGSLMERRLARRSQADPQEHFA